MPVTWDEAGIEELKNMGIQFVDEKALEIASSAAPPVDTGFLKNSVYLYSARVNMFDQTWASDYYNSPRSGGLAPRQRVDSPEPYPENGVTIGWAAIYAWYIEDTTSFMYQALLGASEAGQRFAFDPRANRHRERSTGRFAAPSTVFGG